MRSTYGDGTNSYAWDRSNRLLSVTEWSEALGGVSYAYDGLNNRVSQTISGTITQYLLDLQPGLSVVLAATTDANTDRYIHGPRGIHAQRDAADTWEWMVQDGLGSVRGVADNTGAVQWSGSYADYGAPYDEVGTPQTMYGFTGELTNETGLVHLRARDYNPALGIFTALDPFEGMAQRPMSLNGYSWVEGNVVNLTDPSVNGPCVFCGGPLEGLCFGACDDDDPVAPPYDNTPTVTPCPTPFPFNTNTPPTPPTDTSTPSPTPTPSGTPISLSSVFGGRTAIPLLGATTAVYGAGHAAVDIVPEGSSNAAGASDYAVCRGEVRHKNKEGFRDNPYYNNVVEVVCTNPNCLIIYSHVCPNSQLGNLAASGDLLGTLAGLSAGSGECVDDGSGFPIYGASHLHFEVQDLSSGESVPPSEYLSECQGSNPPSWCAVASDFNQSYLPTPTPNQ